MAITKRVARRGSTLITLEVGFHGVLFKQQLIDEKMMQVVNRVCQTDKTISTKRFLNEAIHEFGCFSKIESKCIRSYLRRRLPLIVEHMNEQDAKNMSDVGCAARVSNLPQCVICFDADVEYMARPCNHLSFCKSCSRRCGSQCPICRKAISQFEKVFL